MLLDDARDKDLEEYQAASTAFVSFKDARTARLALRILDNHPKRTLACHTLPAPDWTDLLWPRLGRSVYRSELVRSWVTFFAVWAFTLAWVCLSQQSSRHRS
jgi:lipopolysaccharide export LptBFGC system permease protein LptF